MGRLHPRAPPCLGCGGRQCHRGQGARGHLAGDLADGVYTPTGLHGSSQIEKRETGSRVGITSRRAHLPRGSFPPPPSGTASGQSYGLSDGLLVGLEEGGAPCGSAAT